MIVHRLFYFYQFMKELSGYILTYNSEKYLEEILNAMSKVCDEIILVDSGSKDKTKAIAEKYKVTFINHLFTNFAAQRNFALSQCKNEYVFFLDCDEVPSDGMIQAIQQLKQTNFGADKYRFISQLNVLGKNLKAGIYPAKNFSYCNRLINKNVICYTLNFLVHEEISAFKTSVDIHETYCHYTFQTMEEFEKKLNQYTDLAAAQMFQKRQKVNGFKKILNPMAAWIKWYLMRKSFLDGSVGWLWGKYAYDYTKMKYDKLDKLCIEDSKFCLYLIQLYLYYYS